MIIKRMIFLLVSLLLITSCANWTSIHRKLNVNDGKGALIDIKQRAIIVNENKHKTDGSPYEPKFVVCAEPSPDSMSALSATIAGEADISGEAKLGLASSLQEGAAFVGLRTQSIQLLRDQMFRFCEMYLNGAIDKSQYQLLQRRNQRYMVALLAIEQLTGAIKVPAVTINSQGTAQLAKNISSLIEEKKSSKEKVDENNEKINTLTTEHATATADRKVEIDNEKKLLAEQNDSLGKNIKDIEKAIASGSGSLASGSSTAIVSNMGVSPQRSDEHIQTVAKHVAEITRQILDTDDFGSLCAMSLLSGELEGVNNSGAKKACLDIFETNNKIKNINIDLATENIKQIKKLNAQGTKDNATSTELNILRNEVERLLKDSKEKFDISPN